MDKSLECEVLNEYYIGDMTALYHLGAKTRQVELLLVPSRLRNQIITYKFSRGNSLVHCKLLGDTYAGSYAGGLTMMNSASVSNFLYDSQQVLETEHHMQIHTHLKDPRGYELIHHLTYRFGEYAASSSVTFLNHNSQSVTLEELSSFCLNALTPFQTSAGEHLLLHRTRSKWKLTAMMTHSLSVAALHILLLTAAGL